MARHSLLVALAFVAAPYLPGLANGFVWLDHREIVEGLRIVNGPSEALALLGGNRGNPGYYRPVYDLMHSLDRAVWGLWPPGFHLSSLLLHLAGVFFVQRLALRFTGSDLRASVVALLWGLHPVNTVAVGLIHAKADVAVATCLLGSLFFATHSRARWRISVSLILFSLALYAKETAYMFPLGVLLFGRELTDFVPRFRAYLVGVYVLTAVAALHRATIVPSGAHVSSLGIPERLATFATVYVDYAVTLLLPLRPSVADTVVRASALELNTALGYVFSFVLIGGTQVVVALRFRTLRPWLALYNLALLPVAQIVPILHFRADRFLYLPSLGFLGAVLQGLWLLPWVRSSAKQTSIRNAACIGLVACFFVVVDVVAVSAFRDDLTLFGRELQRKPAYREGLSVLGRRYEVQGDFVLAERLYRASLTSAPGTISYVDRDTVALNLSSALLGQGRWQEAYDWLAELAAGTIDAEDREVVRYNQAIAARRLGRPAEALKFLERYLARHPQDASAHYVAGLCAIDLGLRERASLSFRRYLVLSPGAPDRASVETMLETLSHAL